MPRSNVRGGKHHKKGKKKRDVGEVRNDKVEYAGVNQIYGLVKKKFGGSRIDVECSDGKNRSAIIPGKFFKKVWINPGDILLCELNVGSDDSVCYILHKYIIKDANILKSQGKITFEVMEDKEEQGYKFTDNQRMIMPQRKIPDINNITNDDSSDEDDNKIKPLNKNNNKEINIQKTQDSSGSSSDSEDDEDVNLDDL